MLCCHLLTSYKNQLFQIKKLSECQTVWMQISIEILLVLLTVQSVCKGYQQMTKKSPLARKEFLFDLILYVPSTIFQLNRDGSSWVEPVLS